MIADYNCRYIYYSGKICNKPCIRPEGCRLHWKKKERPLCIKCGEKGTVSESGRCTECIGGYYVQQYINRLRAKVESKKNIAESSERGRKHKREQGN